MCRNIRPLFNLDSPATEDEVEAAALQFVRKISGFNKPSKTNQAAFDAAGAEVAQTAHALLFELTTNALAENCELEAEKRNQRSLERFG